MLFKPTDVTVTLVGPDPLPNPKGRIMKKFCMIAALGAVLPFAVNAQAIDAQPGFYIGAGGGLDWLIGGGNSSTGVGWAAGGTIGYDFVGPRVSLDVGYG